MAIACSMRALGFSTANAATYAPLSTTVYSPTPGSLPIVIGAITGTATNPLVCGSGQGLGSWKFNAQQGFNANGDQLGIFITDVISGPFQSGALLDCTGDNGTGACHAVIEVAGQETSYVRQVVTASIGAANPTITFASSTLTGNLVLIGFTSTTSAPGPVAIPPAGFTQLVTSEYATPTNGIAIAYRATGATLASYVYSGKCVSGACFGIEVYAPGQIPLAYSDPIGMSGMIY